MSSRKKRGCSWLILAVMCAVAAFAAILLGGIPHKAAVGLAIIAFVGFVLSFNRGYDLFFGVNVDHG